MLDAKRPHLGQLPDRATLAPYLREDREVSLDGFVSWEGSRYVVHWKWVETTVQVGERRGTVEIWSGSEGIACIPGRRKRVSVTSCPTTGRACPGVTTGLSGKQWRCRCR